MAVPSLMERVAFVVDVRSPAGRSELEGREVADLLDQVVALPDPARRQEVRAALASAGPARLEALREGVSHPCWRVRRWSCRLLKDEALDDRTFARLVAAARGDPHKKVRRQALDALVGQSYMPEGKAADRLDVGYDLVGLLLDRLRNDRSVSVRRAAATGLLYQVLLNGNREPRVRRGLRRAIASEQDEALCGRAQQALSSMDTGRQADEYAALRWALAGGRVELALRLVRGHLLQSVGRGGFGEAREWLNRVLAVSEGAPPWLLAAVRHDAGLAALISGDLGAASWHLEASLAQWSVAGERAAGLRTKSLLALVRSFGDDPAGVQDLEGDVAAVRATGDDASLFDVLTACGHARNFRGAPHLARGHFEEAVAVARRAGFDDRIAHALVGLGSAELGQGEYATAEAHLDEAVVRSEAWDDASTEVVGHCWVAELDRLRGDSRSARSRLESCVERARTMGTPSPLAVAVLGLGRAALEEGDPDRAGGLFDEASAVAGRARRPHLVTAARIGQGEVALARGDSETARALLAAARTHAHRRGNAVATACSCYHLGQLARADGDLVTAASLHHEALALRDDLGDRVGVADSLEAVAGLALARGSDDKAARLLGAAEALRQATGCARSRLATASYESDVATLQERMEGDRLESAWAEGRALSQQEAIWMARRGHGARSRPAQGLDALTPAERRVADLVAEGLSNAEVADRLFVTPETVKGHVAKVLAKLGMSSRRELRGFAPP